MTINPMEARQSRKREASLYLSDSEVAARVLGGGRCREWEAIVVLLEREGLPRIDPLMGGRYWPAVRAYLDRRHGLHRLTVPSSADGDETW